jgi:uncharacterized protein YqjF (DUF2071 family)
MSATLAPQPRSGAIDVTETPKTSSASMRARQRMLARREKPIFLADWIDALFIHFEVSPMLLQKQVPFELDLRNGNAYVSVVAFTQRNLRPAAGGAIGRWISRPLACHEFLNIRTYVRFNAETGIYFLAEWIPNRLASLIGPRMYGLPYRVGKLTYQIDMNQSHYDGNIDGAGHVRFCARMDPRPIEPSEPRKLAEFLIERYSAFTWLNGAARRFRIWHEPWKCMPAEVCLHETGLLASSGQWFTQAKAVAAHYSPGVRGVWIGPPQSV